jgi:signal peptidase
MNLKNMNLIEKIINFLLNILIFIFGVILIISIYTGVQTKLLGNDYTDFFGYSIFEVQTGSMEETINAGDWIIVKLTQKVKLDDIVTYRLDKEYITHRIIEVYNGTYITKGDANNAKDDPIDQSQIVGKVVKILGNFGILRKTLFNPGVLITLIITLFLFNMAVKKNKIDTEKAKGENNKEESIYLIFESAFNSAVKKGKILFKNFKKYISKIHIKKESLEEYKKAHAHDYDKKKSQEENKLFKVVAENSKEEEEKLIQSVQKSEEEIRKEEELEKTSIFRVISVDSNEVDDKYKVETPKEEVVEIEDDLDKTSLFRVIPVDASEIDDTLLEIAKNEMKISEQKDKSKKKADDLDSQEEEEPIAEDNEALTKINLESIKSKLGNHKNIIDTSMFIKKEEINELIDLLVDEKIRTKEITVKNIFINTYINARYYDYFGDKDIESTGKSSILKNKKVINKVASDLINDYKGKNKKYTEIVETYNNVFILIANLESAKASIEEVKVRNEFYKKEIAKFYKILDAQKDAQIVAKIVQIQRKYDDTFAYFLKKLETNMFDLKINKLSNKKDMFGLALEHNISFSKVYSDYVIDKTYTEGIVAEDKMLVLFNLLSMQLIKDMVLTNFNRKYILYIPKSLYTKEKKFEKLLRVIDDKYAKDNVLILITYEDLLVNKQFLKKVRKMGYKFALVFNKETTIKEKNRGDLYIADYVFINKKIPNMASVISYIPDELLDNVIYEDIVDKIGDFRGEQE